MRSVVGNERIAWTGAGGKHGSSSGIGNLGFDTASGHSTYNQSPSQDSSTMYAKPSTYDSPTRTPTYLLPISTLTHINTARQPCTSMCAMLPDFRLAQSNHSRFRPIVPCGAQAFSPSFIPRLHPFFVSEDVILLFISETGSICLRMPRQTR